MEEFRIEYLATPLSRPSQEGVLHYVGGKMGVSAVPGSGKTHALSQLAARLVATAIDDDQEVLIVTLVNSAVDTFKRRISAAIERRGALVGFGYRVRTLHGLAHDIVRERPGLVGLAEDFTIVDEREADIVRDDAVEAWLANHPEAADPYLASYLDTRRAARVKYSDWPLLVRDIATAFIRTAKDRGLSPEMLLDRLDRVGADEPGFALARLGTEVYAAYQKSLARRGAVDFDDLVRFAVQVLEGDAEYLARLRRRWPFILEDEAQDSSRSQEAILRLLAGTDGNWVRVGDTNQAIYETFTTANPDLLRAFLVEPGVKAVTFAESGRSQPAIIDLANTLVEWTVTQHPLPYARENAFIPQTIAPTGPDDPQPNPPLNPAGVRLLDQEVGADQELRFVADSIKRWLPDHPDETAAVLVPHNQLGFAVIDLLKRRGIPYAELLRSTTATREAAGTLGNVLRALADPTSPRKLAVAFRVWRRADREDPQAADVMNAVVRRIAACPAVEAYLWPRTGHDWVQDVARDLALEELSLLTGFRDVAQRWHRAARLPVDQLVLALAADLYREPAQLALAHKLAAALRSISEAHPAYRLEDLIGELAGIARNERRFLGFAVEDRGFEPPKGAVTVATIHKAKGLEWDRVYLVAVNSYHFPSGQPGDAFVAERWYIRDNLNLEAEALAQLGALEDLPTEVPDELPTIGGGFGYVEGAATQQARLDYVAERLRLLYVGLTRARRELVVTWNVGRDGQERLRPALALAALLDQTRQGAV